MLTWLTRAEERDFFIHNLPVRIHFFIEMIWWTGFTPWEFGFPVPGSLTSTFPHAQDLGGLAPDPALATDTQVRGRLNPKI